MSDASKWAHIGLVAVLLVILMFFSINIGRSQVMGNSKYTLSTYTGVGSGVLKHGTIVKVVDGKAIVVGHFDDDSGKDYPGTVEIKEVQ
jgi:hypothetical protein